MIIQTLLSQLLGILALFWGTRAQNPCHSECQPFQCHGPLATQCILCTGNKEPVLGQCKCKLGYFDYNGQTCNLYSFDCEAATIAIDGTITCTRCVHGSNGPNNGVCAVQNYMYHESIPNPSYSDSLNTQLFYLSQKCNSITKVASSLSCGGCNPDYYPSLTAGRKSCQVCTLPGCTFCTLTTCLTGCGEGLYLASGPVCNYCFLSCKTCGGSARSDGCATCKEGFYWKANSFDSYGQCLPCSPNCKTCFGPSDSQCSQAKHGYFLTAPNQPASQVMQCDPSCPRCAGSSTTCVGCVDVANPTFDQYLFHQDTSTCEMVNSLSILNCQEEVQLPDLSFECVQCVLGNLYNSVTKTCDPADSLNHCEYMGLSLDRRGVDCLSCTVQPDLALNKDTKNCDQFTGVGTQCLKPVSLSGKYFCNQCASPYSTNLQTGLCVTTCPTGTIPAVFNQASLCVELPVGCLAGGFTASGEFNCTQCNTPLFVKNLPTDLGCMNMICNTQYTGMNKQCSPVLTPATCDSYLCFKTDTPDECTAGVCQRKMWTLVFDQLDLLLKVNTRYDFSLSFDIRDWAIYDTLATGEKKVFCRLISDDLNDDLSTCVYKDGVLRIHTVDPKYRQLLSQGNITIKPAAFQIFRKYLSIDGVDIADPALNTGFHFDPLATLDLTTTRSSNWAVVYQNQMVFAKGIQASLEALTKKINYGSYSWECVSVGTDPALTSELNNLLSIFSNKDLTTALTNTLFKNKLVSMKVNIVDEFGKTVTLSFSFTIVDAPLAIEQPKDSLVPFVEGETVYISLTSPLTTLDLTTITVTAQGLPASGTISSNFEKRTSHLILSLRITSTTSFSLTLSIPTAPATTLWMVRRRANSPPIIIHEKTTDNITPFEFQFISRQPLFKVYCIDEIAKASCLVNANLRSYQPGEAVALQDSFTFTTEGPKLLFFRTMGGNNDTITCSVVDGKLAPQHKTPEISTRAGVAYPESPWVQALDSFFLDLKIVHVSNVVGQPSTYIDNAFIPQQLTADYIAENNTLQIKEQTIPTGFRIQTEVNFTLNTQENHHLIESRFVSSADVATLTGKITASGANPVFEIGTSFSSAGGTCNEGSAQFFHSASIDGKVIIADVGSYLKKTLIPGLFSSPLQVTTTVHSHCGEVSSQTISISDTSSLTAAGTLASYVDTQLLNLGQTPREQLNSLNLLAIQLQRAFSLCNQNACVFPLANVKVQAARILTMLSPTIDETRFTISTRYSLLGAFLWDIGLLDDGNTTSVISNLETTSQLIATRALPLLQANNRLSRDLRLQLSQLDLLLSSKVNFPLAIASNLLNQVLFSYVEDTTRSDRLNRTVSLIVKLYQTKLLRISSHQRIELYNDATIKVQGMTVLSPLSSEYTFPLNSTTLMVFKDLQFSTPQAYFEIILLQWTPALLTKMDTIYNQSTNGFKKGFFYDFQSYFSSAYPASGQALILSTSCPTPVNTVGCTAPSNPPPGYSLCSCEFVVPNAGKVPTVEKATPQAPTPTPPPQTNDPLKDLQEVLKKGNIDGLDPTKLSNFKIWCFSTLILEGSLTVIYITAMLMKKKLDRQSDEFCDKLSTQILIHKMLSSNTLQFDSWNEKSDKSRGEKDSDNSSAHSDSPSPSTASSMSSEQSNLLKKLKSTEVNLDKISVKDLTTLSPVSLFFSYLKMNHMVLSLFFLQSKQYSKGTVVTVTYLRIVAHLAVSMFFTLGMGTSDYSNNQRWILKIVVVPLPLLVVFTGIRRLLSGELMMSNSVKPLKRKSSEHSSIGHDTPTASMRHLERSDSRELPKDDEDGDDRKDNKTSEKDGRESDHNNSKADDKKDKNDHQNSKADDKIDKKGENGEKSKDTRRSSIDNRIPKDSILNKTTGGVASKIGSAVTNLFKSKIWIGRTALMAVTMGSLYSVMAISATSSSKENWPWGFWYAFSLGFDQLVFQPLLALAQFTLVFKYVLGNPSETFKKVTRFFIGKDIMSVFDCKTALANK